METLRVTGSSTTFSSFLDIRKAFDVAWRDGALLRLFRTGVQGADCHQIDDLISDRTAAVRVASLLSDNWDVDDGIGQGTVLGGFLF